MKKFWIWWYQHSSKSLEQDDVYHSVASPFLNVLELTSPVAGVLGEECFSILVWYRILAGPGPSLWYLLFHDPPTVFNWWKVKRASSAPRLFYELFSDNHLEASWACEWISMPESHLFLIMILVLVSPHGLKIMSILFFCQPWTLCTEISPDFVNVLTILCRL